MSKTVLVTGAGGASGLATIRILKESTDFIVIGSDINEDAPGLRIADKKIILPHASSSEYLNRLLSAIENNEVDLILPNVDEEIPVLSSNLRQIPQTLVSCIDTVNICMDKLKTIQALEQVIEVPHVFSRAREVSNKDFPVFVKPRISRGSRNIFLAKNKKQLLAFILYMESLGMPEEDLLVLEFLSGVEYTIEVICDTKGNFLSCVPRVRLSTKGGVCTVGKVVADHRAIEIAKKVTKKLNFVGPINIQVKEAYDGKLKLLEINPRIAGGTPIVYKSGVNIPLLSSKVFFNLNIQKEELVFKEQKVFRCLKEI